MHMDTSTIGARIAAERQRLNANQKDTATAGGVSLRTQAAYEMGESTPNLAYMTLLASIGFDVTYIITGRRVGATVADDEAALLNFYRVASPELRRAALAVLSSASQGSASGSAFNASGGDVNINQVSHGPIVAPQTFTMNVGGRKKKGKND